GTRRKRPRHDGQLAARHPEGLPERTGRGRLHQVADQDREHEDLRPERRHPNPHEPAERPDPWAEQSVLSSAGAVFGRTADLAAPVAMKAARAGRRRLSRDERLAYMLLLPALGAVFVIVTIPFVLVIIQSISAEDGTLVGFRNYSRALANPLLYDAIRATGVY